MVGEVAMEERLVNRIIAQVDHEGGAAVDESGELAFLVGVETYTDIAGKVWHLKHFDFCDCQHWAAMAADFTRAASGPDRESLIRLLDEDAARRIKNGE